MARVCRRTYDSSPFGMAGLGGWGMSARLRHAAAWVGAAALIAGSQLGSVPPASAVTPGLNGDLLFSRCAAVRDALPHRGGASVGRCHRHADQGFGARPLARPIPGRHEDRVRERRHRHEPDLDHERGRVAPDPAHARRRERLHAGLVARRHEDRVSPATSPGNGDVWKIDATDRTPPRSRPIPPSTASPTGPRTGHASRSRARGPETPTSGPCGRPAVGFGGSPRANRRTGTRPGPPTGRGSRTAATSPGTRTSSRSSRTGRAASR